MMTALVTLLIFVAMMQVRLWWIQGEHTVVLDAIKDAVDGIDFDVRDVHQVTGAPACPVPGDVATATPER